MNLSATLSHLILSVVVIAAVTVLAALGKLAGADALAVIAAIGGVGAGVLATSVSGGTSSSTAPVALGVSRQNPA